MSTTEETGTQAIDPTTALRGLLVEMDGSARAVVLEPGNTLQQMYRLIECTTVDVVRLAPELDMWVDREGMFDALPNLVGTFIARGHGFKHQPYFGKVLFLGGVDDHDDTRGLTAGMEANLLKMVTRIQDRLGLRDDWEDKVPVYEEWKARLDQILQRRCGFTSADFADYPFRDAFSDGRGPNEVATEMLRLEGFGA